MAVYSRLPVIFMGLLLSLLLVACDSPPPESVSTTDQPVNSTAVLRFIVHPYDNPSRLVARFTPLCDYLTTQLGRPVQLEIARSYEDQIQRIATGKADLAYMGPTPFLRAQDHYLKSSRKWLQALVAEVRAGRASYRSVLVVRGDSTINSLDEIRGHTIALGSPHSFGSHYVPRVILGNAGLTFSDLKDFAYLGRHERVALSVLHGDFDVGGLRLDVAERYMNGKPGLRVLANSPPLPPHLIVARPGLDDGLATRIRLALLNGGGTQGKLPGNTPSAKVNQLSTLYARMFQALGTNIRFAEVDMSLFKRARRVVMAVENQPTRLPGW